MNFIHLSGSRQSISNSSRGRTASSNCVHSLHLSVYLFGTVLLLVLLGFGTNAEGKSLQAPSLFVPSQILKSQKEVVNDDSVETDEQSEQGQIRAIESLNASEDDSKQSGARKSELGNDSGSDDEEGSVSGEHEDSSGQRQDKAATAAWRQLHFPVRWSGSSRGSAMRWLSPQMAGSMLARPGRADSNFIRFGRSYNYNSYSGESGGDVATGGASGRESRSTSNLNYSNNKKNNFIRLGRENGRQNNFIRLGRRSGGVVEQQQHQSNNMDKRLTSPFSISSSSSNNYVGKYPTSSIGFFPSSPAAVSFQHHKPLGSPSVASLPRNYYYYWGNGNGALRDLEGLGTSKLLERSPLNDAYYYYYNH